MSDNNNELDWEELSKPAGDQQNRRQNQDYQDDSPYYSDQKPKYHRVVPQRRGH